MVQWKEKGSPNITKGSQPFRTQEMMGGGGGSGNAGTHWGFSIPKASGAYSKKGEMATSENKLELGYYSNKVMEPRAGTPKDITPSNLQRDSGTGRSIGKGFSTKHAQQQTTKRRIQNEVLTEDRKYGNMKLPKPKKDPGGDGSGGSGWLY